MSDLQQKLAQKYGAHLICKPETDIVVEGYPRSGNTFTVDMLNVLWRNQGCLKVAHHTHDINNVIVGAEMGKPILILLREPSASIMSVAIFLSVSIEGAAKRYKNFYEEVLKVHGNIRFCRFETVVADFEKVFELVMEMTGKKLNAPDSWSDAISAAKEEEYLRAEGIHGDKVNERVGLPNEKREQMKMALRGDVEEFMSNSLLGEELKSLYQHCFLKAAV